MADPSLADRAAEDVAASGKGTVERLGPNRFEARCDGFEALAAKQETDVWCWAACAAMIHGWYGREVTQEEVAQRIHGAAEDAQEGRRAAAIQRASYEEILGALVPEVHEEVTARGAAFAEALVEELLDDDEAAFDAGFDVERFLWSAYAKSTTNSDILIRDLAAGRPCVVGLREDPASPHGHAYVAYGAEFSRRERSLLDGLLTSLAEEHEVPELRYAKDFALWQVFLIDPWTGEEVEMPAADFAQRVDFMVSSREAEELLRGQTEAFLLEQREEEG